MPKIPTTEDVKRLHADVSAQRVAAASVRLHDCEWPREFDGKLHEIDLTPMCPGVYLLIGDHRIVYVGSSVNVAS